MKGIGKGLGGIGLAVAILYNVMGSGPKGDQGWFGKLANIFSSGSIDNFSSRFGTEGTETSKIISNGGLLSALTLAAGMLMPNWMGGKMIASVGGLLTAYHAAKIGLSNDWDKAAVNFVADKLDVDRDARADRNTSNSAADLLNGFDINKPIGAALSPAKALAAANASVIDAGGQLFTTAPSDIKLATAEKLANGLNRDMAAPEELAAADTPKNLDIKEVSASMDDLTGPDGAAQIGLQNVSFTPEGTAFLAEDGPEIDDTLELDID